jgi:Protein of unknown function (DUF3365)
MMNHRFLTASLFVAPLLLWSGWAVPQDDARKLIEEARKVSSDLISQVRGELTKAIEASGPLRAIIVCKYSVPEISSSISRKTGWKVSRVSLKPRNPALGAADTWEQRVLGEFERRTEKGEKSDELEFSEIVSEPSGRYFRYMKALPVVPLCMNCHGDKMSEAMRSQLATEYPHDKAVGYQLGQIRGAVTIKRPL